MQTQTVQVYEYVSICKVKVKGERGCLRVIEKEGCYETFMLLCKVPIVEYVHSFSSQKEV